MARYTLQCMWDVFSYPTRLQKFKTFDVYRVIIFKNVILHILVLRFYTNNPTLIHLKFYIINIILKPHYQKRCNIRLSPDGRINEIYTYFDENLVLDSVRVYPLCGELNTV